MGLVGPDGRDLSRAHRVSRRLRAGLVWVNCYFDGDVTVPFGGVTSNPASGRDKSLHALDKVHLAEEDLDPPVARAAQ